MWRCLAILTLSVLWVEEASAQLFRPKPKPAPADQVPQLLEALQNEKNDRRRADAAEELRNFDTKAFPQIVPQLINTLKNDISIGVRIEAATSLGRLPGNAAAATALENARDNDPAPRVRAAAWAALIKYSVVDGIKPNGPMDPNKIGTAEPPLADPPFVRRKQPTEANPTLPSPPTTTPPTKIEPEVIVPLPPLTTPKIESPPPTKTPANPGPILPPISPPPAPSLSPSPSLSPPVGTPTSSPPKAAPTPSGPALPNPF